MRQVYSYTQLVLSALLFSASVQAQDLAIIEGNWTGLIDKNNRQLSINVTFSYNDNLLDGTINIPEQEAYTLPIEVLDFTSDTLVFQFQTGTGEAVFYGNWNARTTKIDGNFSQGGELFTFHLRKTSASGPYLNLPESEISIPTRAGQIGGSLLFRENGSPLVILTSGSGSKDRDQNIAGFRTFRLLSSKLYEKGYSTFRYDARGIGQSEGNTDATLQEMAEDVVDITEYLKSEYRSRISGVILLGHAEGGLVVSLAARDVNVDGLILMATPLMKGDEIINDQIRNISEVRGISDRVVELNLAFQERVYNVVRTGSDWGPIEDELAGRLELQIRKLPEEQRNALGDMSSFVESQVERQLSTAKSRWFKSLLELEPTDVISGLDTPMIALFGEKDTQVLPARNRKIASDLESHGDISIDYVVIPEANHLFQNANSGMPSEYGMLEKKFTKGLIEEIDGFLDELQLRAPD